MIGETFLPLTSTTVKLGRVRPLVLPQVLPLRNYLLRDAPVPPTVVSYSAKAQDAIKKVYLNDQLGCCVISGKMHQIGIWSANDAEKPVVLFTDADVVKYYGIIGGYKPGQPWTDRGCSIVDALNYLKTTGFNGHKIAGYVGVDIASKVEVQVAEFLFGSLTLGLNTPDAWIANASNGAIWGPAPANPRNGHDVCVVGYNEIGVQVCTWGMVVTIRWDAFQDKRIVEECYAEVGLDWVGQDQKAPSGVLLPQLMSDLLMLGGGLIPPLPQPEPPPAPPPVPVPPAPVPPSPPQPTGSRTIVVIGATSLSVDGKVIPVASPTPPVGMTLYPYPPTMPDVMPDGWFTHVLSLFSNPGSINIAAEGHFLWDVAGYAMSQLLPAELAAVFNDKQGIDAHRSMLVGADLNNPKAFPWQSILAIILAILQGLNPKP